jgi:hypothetical protein
MCRLSVIADDRERDAVVQQVHGRHRHDGDHDAVGAAIAKIA